MEIQTEIITDYRPEPGSPLTSGYRWEARIYKIEVSVQSNAKVKKLCVICENCKTQAEAIAYAEKLIAESREWTLSRDGLRVGWSSKND